MLGLALKLVIAPWVVTMANLLFPGVNYPFIYQAILVGIILALLGHALEVLLLRQGTLWINTLVDFLVFTVIIYLSSFLFPGARVTLMGAWATALLLNIAEFLQHLYLIRSGRAEK